LFSFFPEFIKVSFIVFSSPFQNAFQEVPGSSILEALTTLRKQGFSSLPQYYLRAGSALLVRNIT